MKFFCISIFLASTFLANSQQIDIVTWNKITTLNVFTVNEFNCITVDKTGKIWAGSELGGLYTFNGANWHKEAVYEDITFKDIMPSNIQGDNGVWAASIGKNASQASLGGVYYFNNVNNSFTRYGSGTEGGLSSRHATSLAMNGGFVYVGLDRANTGISEGGVYRMNMTSPQNPTNNSFLKMDLETGVGISYQAVGIRKNETWFAKAAYCGSTCLATRIFRFDKPNTFITPSVTGANSLLPFSTAAGSPIVKAIFTDETTNFTYVGLSNGGGIGVRNANDLVWNATNWHHITSNNSILPFAASVNHNAIIKVFNEIWVGTSRGIFIYNGCGKLNDFGSFSLLNTSNGLPSDNITDIAFDSENSMVWITSPAGVSRFKYPLKIKGTLEDVSILNESFKKDQAPVMNDVLKLMPVQNNISVELLDNGNSIEIISELNSCGGFEFKKPIDGKTYTIAIKYKAFGKDIRYEMSNVPNHTDIGTIKLPGTLISEISDFKQNMAIRTFKLDLQEILNIQKQFNGFDVSKYDDSYRKFLTPEKVTTDHNKQVENLANYLAGCGAVYKMGGDFQQVLNEGLTVIGEIIKAGLDAAKISKLIKGVSKLEPSGEFLDKVRIKWFFEGFEISLNYLNNNLVDKPNDKEVLTSMIAMVGNAKDIILNEMEKKKEDKQLVSLLISKAANVAGSYFSGIGYEKYYCNSIHKQFIEKTAALSYSAGSSQPYDITRTKLKQLEQNATVILEEELNTIKDLKESAKLSELLSDFTLLTAAISVFVPGAQPAIAPLVSLSAVCSADQITYLTRAAGRGVIGSGRIGDVSFYTDQKMSAPPITESFSRPKQYSQLNLPIGSLINYKNLYINKLQELKAVYDEPNYDSLNFYSKFRASSKADSFFISELQNTLLRLWPFTDSAILLVPGFRDEFESYINKFVTSIAPLEMAFYYQNIAYELDAEQRQDKVSRLHILADSLILLADSSVNGITRIIDSISNYGIGSQAYLVKTGYVLNHTQLIGEPGSVSHTFTNMGGEPQYEVSFKFSPPTGGYNITSADSIFVGTILPGESKTISFAFSSPLSDSAGNYFIHVNASNGLFQDAAGTLFSYDPSKTYSIVNGDWNNPNIWSTGIVPNANSVVEIGHHVTVNVDVHCKFIQATGTGKVTISPNKKLTIGE